jgi:hypothetical protein
MRSWGYITFAAYSGNIFYKQFTNLMRSYSQNPRTGRGRMQGRLPFRTDSRQWHGPINPWQEPDNKASDRDPSLEPIQDKPKYIVTSCIFLAKALPHPQFMACRAFCVAHRCIVRDFLS